MRRTVFALLPLVAASGANFMTGLDCSLRGMGDCPVATIASCGAQRSAVLSRALGAAEGEPVDMVGETIALLDTTGTVDSAIAIATSSVVALELRQADLIHDGPHGMRQLGPALQRWLRLQTGGEAPAKKKLLLLVTEADAAEAPVGKLTDLAAAALARVVSGIDSEGALDAKKLFELELITVPSGAEAAALGAIKDEVSKLGESWTLPASAALEAVERAEKAGLSDSASAAVSVAEANDAYACAQASDAATRVFTLAQGLPALKKSAEAFMDDFGDQATALLDEALATFDAATEGNGAAAAARAHLRTQLLRALSPLFRRQLAMLQRQTLTSFEQKLRATQPSVQIEKDLKAIVKEASVSFDKQAATLLVPGCSWSYGFEKKAVENACKQSAAGRVEELRIQGLYLPKKGAAIPVDIHAHVFFPAPFGAASQDVMKAGEGSVKVAPMMAPLNIGGEGDEVPNLSEPNPINRNGMVFKNGKVAGSK